MRTFFRCAVLACSLSPALLQAQSTPIDYYSPIVEWQQVSGFDVTPIHAGLLPNGNVFFVNAYNFFENPDMDLTAPGFNPEFVFVMQPTPAYVDPPASVLIGALDSPTPLMPLLDAQANTIQFKSLACSGHSLMADGSLFFASGVDANVDLSLYNSGNLVQSLTVDGIAESFSLNPFTTVWTQNPDTLVAAPVTGEPLRWYSTVTRLADSRMLVTGGYEQVFPLLTYNTSVEVFDPAANSWSVLSSLADTPPGIENPDYTHVFQFPYDYVDSATGNSLDVVLMLGGSGEPLFLYLQGQDKFWYHTDHYRPGAKEFIDASAPTKVFPGHGSSSAMLPIRLPGDGWGYANGSVITVGGAHHTPMEGNIDVYDPGPDAWRPSIPMSGLRHHGSTVILPDGRILILAGHDDESPTSQTGYAEYVDPKNNFALSQGVAFMPETRGYHTVSILLPDGRVLLGGGNVSGRDAIEQTNFRYYYPDYMFKPRPWITYTQNTIRTGAYSLVFVPHMTNIDEASLMGLGSMTHSFDMSQRSVQLRLFDLNITMKRISGAWVQVDPAQCVGDPAGCLDVHAIQAPITRELAPPGYYMLFILDENRVPSPGKIVKLE